MSKNWDKAFEYIKKIKGCSSIITDFENGKISEKKLNFYISQTNFFINEISELQKHRDCSASEVKNLNAISDELKMLQNYQIKQIDDKEK